MRRYIRSQTAGATYFFTVALQDRTARTLTDHFGHLRAALVRVREIHPFHIDAMVVLPDHLHALWTLPAGDADFPLRWRLLKRAFTRRLLSARALEAPAARRRGVAERSLWQRRYWEHQIRDEEDFARHVDYIHFNPVKHGWAARAAEWPYSSFHRFVREGMLPANWGARQDSRGRAGESGGPGG